MNYTQAVQYIEDAGKYGSRLGLERMEQLMELLGNPQDKLRFVHIAGTNGKGSVLAYISTVLHSAGYKTGSYSSPAVADVREHFQINGNIIEEEQYAACVEKLQHAVCQMEQAGGAAPTVFELETALAFLYFEKNQCDMVVLETGLGGLEDATNIIKTPVLSVITAISMDHKEVLGSTIEKIAEKKAGIIKAHVPVVMMENEKKVTDVIKNKCRETNSELFIASETKLRDVEYGFPVQKFRYDQFANARINMLGKYQVMNATLAIEAFGSLRNSGIKIPASAIREGLFLTKWPYRMEQILNTPQFFIDGAHNPEAAERLMESVKLYFEGHPLIFILGVFKDKDYTKICEITAGIATYIITVQTPDSERALPAEILKKTAEKYNKSAEAAESLEWAAKRSLALAGALKKSKNEKPVIIAFGSLAYLAQLKQIVLKKQSRRGNRDGQK